MMQHRNILKIIYLAVLLVLSGGNNLFSQNVQQKATRQSSLDAFNSGDYEKAYFEFTDLLETYPKDPLYKYYAGVSLVKTGREPEKALLLLRQSQQGSVVVRTVPVDVIFWRGRALQLCGQYAEAETSYMEFAELAGKKRAREYGVQDFIQQCRDRKGLAERNDQLPAENIKTVPGIEEKTGEEVITAKNELSQDYDKILSEALEYQEIADSLKNLSEDLGKKMEHADARTKSELQSRRAAAESMATDYQKRADEKFEEAQLAMSNIEFASEKISDELPVIEEDSANIQNDVIDIVKPDSQPLITSDTSSRENLEIFQELSAKEPTVQGNKDLVSEKEQVKEKEPVSKKPAALYSVFGINQGTVYKPGEKIPVDASIPEGLIYRIQLAVFRNPVSPSYFKGISPVYGFKVAGTDRTAYFAGMFRKHADAVKALVKVKQVGFKDAFIVSLSGGKAISAERAAILEKEWGSRPLANTPELANEEADTVPPTLSFRIEVARGSKPVTDELIETYKRMAGTRGFDIYIMDDGTNICLIGHFITYESAEEYASLLARNGLRDARVTSWLGKKEIPVETARQLFEKLE